jgi:uncharacterized membrane-anchored protein YjiN (DUF445 family)
MSNDIKIQRLKNAQRMATGLLILVTLLFIGCKIGQRYAPWQGWGFLIAFSEASMVGALADWFAVVALFRHPLGLPIPHTNLVAHNQTKLGDNMGNFVRDNFLSETLLRDKIAPIKFTPFFMQWVDNEDNIKAISTQIAMVIPTILQNVNEQDIEAFIENKGRDLLQQVNLRDLGAQVLDYLLEKQVHQQLLTEVLLLANKHLENNENFIYEKVKENTPNFLPAFVDNFIAEKIVKLVEKNIQNIEKDEQHQVRKQFDEYMREWAIQFKTHEQYAEKIHHLRDEMIQHLDLPKQAKNVLQAIKMNILQSFMIPDSPLKQSIYKTLGNMAKKALTDEKMRERIDNWIREKILQIAVQNQNAISEHISQTVRNWGKADLSDKLELAIGRDLQFIRVNGTLVGGTVGLILYFIFEFLLHTN